MAQSGGASGAPVLPWASLAFPFFSLFFARALLATYRADGWWRNTTAALPMRVAWCRDRGNARSFFFEQGALVVSAWRRPCGEEESARGGRGCATRWCWRGSTSEMALGSGSERGNWRRRVFVARETAACVIRRPCFSSLSRACCACVVEKSWLTCLFSRNS